MGDGSFEINRRDLLKLGAMAPVAGIALAACNGAELTSDPQRPPVSRPTTRALVDVHVHIGITARAEALAEKIHSAKDYALLRSKDPKLFAEIVSDEQIDNSDLLVKVMEENGVTHAIIQATPGRDASNQRVADIARRHRGRFFPLYRPEIAMDAIGAGNLTKNPDKAVFSRNARSIAEDIESLLPELGMIGVGEIIPGGVVTASSDPFEIVRDMGPIMEALRPGNLPIQIPTGWSGWQGGLHYIFNPIWVDELAGNFPDVPIVLTKMGRGFRASFDACAVVAMRNASVYLEMTDAQPEHVQEALQRIGHERIMFGTDLSGISVNYAYEEGFHILDGVKLNAEQWEWIAWRTANKVYRLNLEA